MVTVEIDGREFQAEPGQTIIEIADREGIYIPRFCYHEKLSVAANCRMCMVEVERAPKPLAACATPVADGMVIRTNSSCAVGAQKDTLEFLLINHPLDCPICDQGGECPLQDQALGYGGHSSRYIEKKRVVSDHSVGPLIATEMTRCIHCTRCVRFGDEVAGVMEFGLTHRSEHLKIDTFFDRAVDSEVSGNVIDLCPVGALTSKPYRFTARSWEMISHDSISPHDCVGTNIQIQALRGEIKRVLPRVNEQINECWIADRDRYSYEALVEVERLGKPMMRTDSGMIEIDWQAALSKVSEEIRLLTEEHGAEALGALVSPTATLEEFYLMQKLMRGLGSNNIDHRLRQVDFSADPNSGSCIRANQLMEHLTEAKSVLLIGSNIRKEQPILGVRLRKAWKQGTEVASIGMFDYPYHFKAQPKSVVMPKRMPAALAQVLKSACRHAGKPIPDHLQEQLSQLSETPIDLGECDVIAKRLCSEGSLIILGQTAISHRNFSIISALADALAAVSGSAVWVLPPANSAAGWRARCLPHDSTGGSNDLPVGRNAWNMMNQPLRGYLLFDVEPPFDMADGVQAQAALQQARFVVSFQAYRSIPDYVDVALPIAPFTENSGTFVNFEGKAQWASAAIEPYDEARPGWKILRVLGNFFEVPGFDYITIDDVTKQASANAVELTRPAGSNGISDIAIADSSDKDGLELICEHSIYAVDPVVRRAPALQNTADASNLHACIHPDELRHLGINDGDTVQVTCDSFETCTHAVADSRVPAGCVYMAAGKMALPASGSIVTIRSRSEP